MAKILDFVRRTPRPQPGGDALAALLQDFSIEVMPRTAAKIEDFRAILPAGTRDLPRPHRRHRLRRDARHRPAPGRRGLPGDAARPGPRPRQPGRARRPARRLRRSSACDQALVIAGGIDTPRGPFSEAMQILRTGLFDARGFTPPARRRPPGGQPRHRPRGRRRASRWPRSAPRTPSRPRPTPRWRSPPSSASRPARSSPGPTACAPPASPCRSTSASPAPPSSRP